jgi:hypothetical protein
MPDLTAFQFVEQWEQTDLKERASAQSHFESVCRLVGHELPHEKDPRGEFFTYEYGVEKASGGKGYADVWFKGHFAIEYKGKGRYNDLEEAYRQLQQYRENLQNPPLLIVCDIEHWEIHTNFTNTEKKVFRFTNQDLMKPDIQQYLRWMFHDVQRFKPGRDKEDVTADAANAFQIVAEHMRKSLELRREADIPARIAHFLTKILFCMFAEDVGLLPTCPGDVGIFTDMIQQTKNEPARFTSTIKQLFDAMAEGGSVMYCDIPYFNGSLFEDVSVENVNHDALFGLHYAAQRNWVDVAPSIFGTLFERTLDPGKRSQLGAHYTSQDDIELIIKPVLMQPLEREWGAIKAQADTVRDKFDSASTERARTTQRDKLIELRGQMLTRLRTIKVLDPACGSGNFLYVALQNLMNLEKEVITDPVWSVDGLPAVEPQVHPDQLYGIEINPIAHALTSVVIWIGYIQWRENNGYPFQRAPILTDLSGNMRLMDAIMRVDPATGAVTEPDWPNVDVIVGNPPFLGGNRIRAELGDTYVDNLFSLYEGRVSALADVVTYWFEKARTQLTTGKAKRVGLLSTNSIRGGANRRVLDRIKDTGDIFMAWADREWILEGAAVRVSMVGFDGADEVSRNLDGISVNTINADLTGTIDLTVAKPLVENSDMVARGIETGGPFELLESEAVELMSNPMNSPILVPTVNGNDITNRKRNLWVIDFEQTPDVEPTYYEEIYKLLRQKWEFEINDTSKKRRPTFREEWWKFRRSGEKLRNIVKEREKYICTPRVAKHRLFVWLEKPTLPDSALFVIARDDDYFFGVLHSRLHEIWSLRMGTSLEDRPRYTPTTTFETFPFPWKPGDEPIRSADYRAIAEAAKNLHAKRHAWLNPDGLPDKNLKKRTLTNLYNAAQVLRGRATGRVELAAGDFAPELVRLHDALDAAVCAAYGWDAAILKDDEAILRELLALNGARAG